MPNTRENAPPPPEDRDFQRSGSRALGVAIIVCVVFVCAAIAGIAVTLSKAGQKNTAFMAKCIEFHSSDRCSEFWRYGRADLAERLER